jgi:hypothetical protein
MYLVSELTPKGAEALLQRIGTMTVSKSTLHRLPNAVRETWEADRTAFEDSLRSTIVIPPNAFSVAVSLDGVMAPMVDGRRAEKRAATEAAGLSPSGPAGYREVGCATVSFCDGKGDLISAIRMARSPEKNKLTLKEMVQAELSCTRRSERLPVAGLKGCHPQPEPGAPIGDAQHGQSGSHQTLGAGLWALAAVGLAGLQRVAEDG